MTLIATAVADDAIVQVSDRRITANGKPRITPENKAVCVSCRDARFTIAFTGLANIGHTSTASWILEALYTIGATQLSLPEILEKLRAAATAAYRTLPPDIGKKYGLSLVLAGFGKTGAFTAVISNMEDDKGARLNGVADEFKPSIFLSNRKRKRGLNLMFNGAEQAIDGTFSNKVLFKVARHFLRRAPIDRTNMLVYLIRRAADHPKYGKSIGKECTSVIITSSGDTTSNYHEQGGSNYQYAPHILQEGMMVKDIKYSIPPGWSIQFGGD